MKASAFFWILSLLLIGFMLLTPGMHGGIFFWIFLIIGFLLLFNVLTEKSGGADAGKADSENADMELEPETRQEFDSITDVIMNKNGRKENRGILAYEGVLKVAAPEASEQLSDVILPKNRDYFLEDLGDGESRLVIFPAGKSHRTKAVEERSPRWALHWGLVVATLLTTTWAGAIHQGVNLLEQPDQIVVGLPYALGLLLILGAHEMGHYLTARRYRMKVSPPYFIPIPFALGTFGAFISLKSTPTNRRNLFDVAIAGPLAGLAVAVPALLIGLPLSTLVPGETTPNMMEGGASLGSSVLLAAIAKLSLGADLSAAHNVIFHPLAFAGWLGLILTALNLLPIGQLDGGHVAQSLFGARRGRGVSSAAMVGLFGIALFVWPGLLFFAILVFFIAGSGGLPPRDDVTGLDRSRRWVGYSAFVLLLLIITPLPHGLYDNFGLHCPYL